MKLPEMKWTQRNCIMCALVIIAIFLTMYLFRHYTLIEGFDFSMPDTSAITTSASSLTASASALTSSLPSLSSNFGSIGPLPADNKWTDQTLADFTAKFSTVMGKDVPPEDIKRDYFKLATEDDAKYYIANGKWDWPSFYIDCFTKKIKKSAEDDAKTSGKPAPSSEDIQKKIDEGLDTWQKRLPIRVAVYPVYAKMLFEPCITDLKESQFLGKFMGSPGITEKIVVGENKSLRCVNDYDRATNKWTGSVNIITVDPATNQSTSEQTSFDKIPSLVSGFKYLKDGKTVYGEDASCSNFTAVPFTLDNSGVSPFYQAFWGVPASSSSTSTDSTPASVSSSSSSSTDPTAVLKDMKAKLNSMSL